MFSFFLTGALLVAAANAAYLRRPITPEGRIIGGDNATIETYPYQVSLVYQDQHFCGGSIISEKYVLTAGHCLPKYLTEDLGNIVIRAGSSIRNEGGSVHKIAFFKVHEDYYEDNRIPVNDVALIRVVQRFQFDDTRQPISLYGIRELTAAGENAVITGWGRTEYGTPKQLQTVTVPVISKELCSSAYHGLHPGQICAAYYGVGGKDTCQGDSGGPMVVGDRLAGITSWGSGCAHPKYPGVYTEVSHYREWIKSHAGL